MPAIETWLRQPAAQAVGWALLQFVWQGAAVGALTAGALLVLRRSASDVRYVVASIGLALMLTLPIVTGAQKLAALRAECGGGALSTASAASTLVRVNAEATGMDRRGPAAAAVAVSETSPARRTWVARLGALRADALRADALLPTLMLVWLAGVSLLSLRLLTGWLWVQRLRTRGIAPPDPDFRRMAARLARRLHITRAVTLLESSLVDVPTVIGFLSPVVLLPVSALAGLSAQQIEAILAHELAHIRRHDYLVNLLQTLVETVLFYHPAVWWLSRRIRIERENCCDDLAVSLCGDPVAYATALADLEALRSSGPAPERHIAMAATGGSLLHRVRRLLGAPSSHSGRGPAWLAGSVAILLIGGIAVGADGSRAERAVQTTPASTEVGRWKLEAERWKPEAGAWKLEAGRWKLEAERWKPEVGRWKLEAERWKPEAGAWKLEAGSWKPEAERWKQAAERWKPEAGSWKPEAGSRTLEADSPAAPLGAVAATPMVASAPAAAQTSISHQVNDSTGSWTWSNNGEKLQVTYSGTFEFTDDDTDVRQLSAGGSLKISDGNWFGRHSVEIRERNGQLEHLYYVNASARPYEPEGRVWLQQNLPKFVRNTGIGAEARVARMIKSGGPSAVTAEIARIDSTYVKGIYFKQLFKQAALNGEQYRQAMAQAAREMRSSSYELAQLLIAASENLPNDEASRAAYFEAASAIHSDYERRRVSATMLKRGPVSSSILGGILASARSISSDYELSELLRQILSQQPLDDRNRTAFFNAVATIDSAYERHRVLSAVISSQRASDPALLEGALAAAASLHSNYELSQFLQEMLRQNGVEGNVRAPFFAAVNGIDSNYERGRVLQAVVKKPGVSHDTLRAVLQSSRAMNGYELSQVLQAIATTHVVSGDLRDAYLDAADRLGGYEQGQVLTALVKSERRK